MRSIKEMDKRLDEREQEIERLNTDKEQLTSLVNSCQEEIRKLKSQLQQKENKEKELRKYIEKHKNMTQGSFNGKEWVEQYFELVCDPKELLEILDKVGDEK